MARRLLFVCGWNQDRSPTAERIFKAIEDIEVKSAGTSQYARVRITPELIRWADKIFAMEEENRMQIIKIDSSVETKTDVLGILDKYHIDNEHEILELERLLENKNKTVL